MDTPHAAIDLIYLWVDGNDPKWQAKKRTFTGTLTNHSETDNKGRYFNNDELKYSLRSAEKHAPWIRRIFIVTDNQHPAWLNTDHPRIRLIDHKDIMPPEVLPSFNSSVIEYFLHRIPGLSAHFLYANDDMFFNADLTPDFFFEKDGYPIVRLKRKPFGRWYYRLKALAKALVGKKLGQYSQSLMDASQLVEKRFGKYYPGVPHHNIDSYRITDFRNAVEFVFKDGVESSQYHRVRTFGDLHRSAFSYYALAIGHAHLQYVGRKEASRISVHKDGFMDYIKNYQPLLFCLNDTQRTKDNDREKIRPFLETLFPTKSAFEK